MEVVRTISCSKKITAELAINVEGNTIEYKTSSLHGENDVFELPFTITVGDGLNYHGKIVLWKDFGHQLNCYVYDVKYLTGNVSMMVSKDKTVSHITENERTVIPNAKYLRTHPIDVENVAFLKGSYTITFEPMDEKLFEEKLINSFSILKQDQLEDPKDVRLVVHGKEFEFNMSCLAQVSPMFRDLFQNCTKENKIPIADGITTLQTMVTFQKILVHKPVEPQEITMDLYKFADKYNIQPLVKFCGDHLGLKINNENVLEIAMVADMANDEALLKKAATFLMMNPGIDMKNFLKNNPGFGDKLVAKLFLAMRK